MSFWRRVVRRHRQRSRERRDADVLSALWSAMWPAAGAAPAG